MVYSMEKHTQSPSNLRFSNISDEALAQVFDEKTLKKAAKIVKTEEIKGVEYNPSDNAVYAVIESGGSVWNLDISENASGNLEFNSDIEDGDFSRVASAAVLMIFRTQAAYTAQYHASVASTKAGSQASSAKSGSKKSGSNIIRERLIMLSTEELTDMLLEYASKNADIKRDLTVRFNTNNDAILKALLADISKVFPKSKAGYARFSASTALSKLNPILASIDKLPQALQREPLWTITEGIFALYKSTDIDSKRIADILERCKTRLLELHAASPIPVKERQQMLTSTMRTMVESYYNYGFPDSDKNWLKSLCLTNDDRTVLIEIMKGIKERWIFKNFTPFLTELYALSGDSSGKRVLLEQNLEIATDYAALAVYWQEEGNMAKALEVAKTGMEKVQGLKIPLLQFFQNHYQAENNYEALWEIFEKAVNPTSAGQSAQKAALSSAQNRQLQENLSVLRAAGFDFSTPQQIVQNPYSHPYFNVLIQYYHTTNNYQRVKQMLEFVYQNQFLSFQLYTDAEQYLTPEDRDTMQSGLMKALRSKLTAEEENHARIRHSYSRYAEAAHFDAQSPTRQTLASIYRHRGELDLLWETIRTSFSLCKDHEKEMLPLHTDEYIAAYMKNVEYLLNQRHNQAYEIATTCVLRIREILTTVKNKPEEWKKYLEVTRIKYKALRNFMKMIEKL